MGNRCHRSWIKTAPRSSTSQCCSGWIGMWRTFWRPRLMSPSISSIQTLINGWVSEWVVELFRKVSKSIPNIRLRSLCTVLPESSVPRGFVIAVCEGRRKRVGCSLLLSHSPCRVSPFRRPWVMMARATGLGSSMYARRSAYAIYRVKRTFGLLAS